MTRVPDAVAAIHTDLGVVGDTTGLDISGDAVLPSPYRVDVAATASVAAATLAAGRLWHLRGGPPAHAHVDVRHASLAFRSERYLRVDGAAPPMWADLSGDYRAADGWVRLHANYPAHRDAILRALDAPADRDRVAAAVRARPAVDVEEAVITAGGAAAAARTPAQWAAHPHGTATATLPLVALDRVDHSPPRPLSPADSPLGTVRVLDLTRVIAGPVCGRTLAGYGADVLRVGADHLALVPPLVIDTGFGKRFCHLDLRTPDGAAALRGLVTQADILVQAYRPGALDALGFGPAACAALRPGLVYVSISAWGHAGPWQGRRGFDSLVQMASGIAAGDPPVPLPAQVLDHATGWLAAAAAMEALRRRHRTGGAWHARLSLARTAAWLDGLGRTTATPAEPGYPHDLVARMGSPFGTLDYVRQPGALDGYVPRWVGAPHRPGADPPTFATAPPRS
jgi:crotonobetainyl-CoA:carnitine CoA-transferase CaiB-like acyl-CoA transferase